jgi:heavy metal sensor kinase
MRRLRRMPIRARLTLAQVGVFAVIFGAFAFLLGVNEWTTLQRNAQESLELTSRVVVDRIAEPGTNLTTIMLRAAIPGESGAPEVIGQVLSPSGGVVDRSADVLTATPLIDASVLGKAASSGHWHGRLALPGRAHDDMVMVIHLTSGARSGDYLVLAQTLASVDHSLQRLVLLLLVAAPVAIALAVAGGWVVSRAALRPVDDLTRRAAAVDASGEFEPLPVPAANDELSRLASTLNAMLDRLRRSLDLERRFSADASHELRTPIGIMEAELDVALRSRTTPPEAKEVLSSVRDEAASLARIVANLVLLARADAAGEVTLERQDADLLDIAGTVANRFRHIATERGIALHVEGEPAQVVADADMLRQAVSNLVENALRYTDPGGTVTITVTDQDTPSLAVTDTGTGIPADELPHVFDRFYRVDGARRRARGGAGLGLEISRRIVEAHGARIDAESEAGKGSRFSIVFGTRRTSVSV